MAGRFEVYQDEAGRYYWMLKASDGQVMATGQGYDTQADAVEGVRAVRGAVEGSEIYAAPDADSLLTAAKTVTVVNAQSKLIKIED